MAKIACNSHSDLYYVKDIKVIYEKAFEATIVYYAGNVMGTQILTIAAIDEFDARSKANVLGLFLNYRNPFYVKSVRPIN